MWISRGIFLAALALSLAGAAQSAAAQGGVNVIEVEPQGVYAEIDVADIKAALAALNSSSRKKRVAAVDSVEAQPDRYAPPVLYALSKVLFDNGEKDKAAFWYYAGQLRGRFDANRCADISARSAIEVLNRQYGPRINQYAIKDPDKLEQLVLRVAEWDRETPHAYDHRWINLHGLNAMGFDADAQSAPLSLPEEDWSGIAEQTRTEYLKGFYAVLPSIRAQQ